MDERRYQELSRIAADLDRGVTPFEAATRNMSLESRLDAARTIDYMNYQSDFDDDVWRPWAAFYNGFVVQGVGGLVGSLQMLRDKNIRQHQDNAPNYQENYEATAILDNVKKSSILTPYKIRKEDTADQVIYGLIEGAGQLASQVIVNSLTGGTAGTIYMGAQIAGNQYAELREQGVDSDRAFNAALINAVAQANLEKVGLDKILERIPGGSGLKETAMQILKSAVAEGVTEGLQELPEQFTDIWAKNPNMNAREIGREWDENTEANIKDIVFSGVLGGLLGGGASGLNMTIKSKLEKYANKAQVERVEQNAEIIKSSGINPERAAEEIDKRKPEGVSVDAAVLRQAYGRTAGELRKVADSLGVTEEEINEAAANGLDIGVTRGKLTATMASVNGFAQTVHDHISFNDGASSINYAEMQKDLTAAYEAGEQAAGELDTELDNIIASAKEAGMAQPQAEGLRTLLESRAMIANPENPAAWLKKHGLRFVDAGKARVQGSSLYQMSESAEIRLAADEKAFGDSVDALMKNALASGKPIKVMTTPLALKAAGAPLLPVEIEYENLHKILRGKHSKDMSASIVKQLPRALTDPLMIFKSYDGKNGEKRMVVAVDLKDNKGATIVVPFELKQNSASNTYQLNAIKSAYGKTDNKTGDPSYNYFKKQIESGNVIYLNKKRTAVWNLSAGLYLPMDGSTEGPTLSGYNNQQKSATGSSIIEDIITQHNKDYKDENDLQALQNEYPGYYQTAYHGTQHSFEQFDLGAIGSGVGLQAHGWGLYFTADKKVAEEYKEFTGGKGFVYEADIPENDVLLDAGKFFGEQPAKVKRAINKIIENLSDEELENFDDVGSLGRAKVIRSIKESLADSDGENIYGTIYDLISDGNKGRDTSLLLNKYGVKGIAYEDKGKRNFVVFDDKAVNIINRENEYKKIEDALKPSSSAVSSAVQNLDEQSSFANSVSQKGQVYKQQRIVEGKNNTKGMIEPQEDGRYIISLFEYADASTVIHETGHYFFDTFMKDSALPEADARMKRDRQRLLDYVGMTEEQWNTADLEGRRAAHERMAEAFETYIMEGKAPSRNLRSLFNRFSKWLKAIYEKHVRSNNAAELTPEVRDVFDHWLAADMDIQQAAKAEGILGKLPDAITKNLSDKSRQWLEDKITNAKDEAVNMLTKEYMRNFTPERRKAIAEFKVQITPDIEKQVAEMPVNRARAAVADAFAKYPRRRVKDTKFYEVERNGRTFVVSKDRREEVMLAANPKTIAWKYKHVLGGMYYNYADRLAAVEKEINDALAPLVEELKQGYGHGVEDFWIDTETGQEVDVSGLTEEKRTGYQYKRMRRSLNAPWYQSWYKDKKHPPTKRELRELAYNLYTGVDKYGFYTDMNLFSNAQEAAEFDALSAERKAEIDELISYRDAIKANPELVEMSKRRALSDENRVSFELIANEFGYDSGDAMADAIINEPSAQKMVRDRVEQAVNARFPDAAKERELAEAATMEALYNDESGMVIALEQQLIEDAAYEVATKDRSSKAREALAVARKAQTEREAEAAMRKLTMADALRASKFAMAERRAAAKAQKAIKKGNMEEAAEYKRQQAIAHAMVRKSIQLKQEVERNRKFIRKLRTMKKENFGTEQHLNQIGAFLARMGLVRKDYNPNNKTQTLQQYLTEMREKLGDMVVSADEDWPSFILDESYDLRDSNGMSIEQYGSVVKMLKQLRNIAKQDTQMELEGKAIFAKENKEIVLAELDNMDTVYTPEPGEHDKPSRLKRLSWGRLNADTLFEKMDGWKQGFFSKAWYGLLKHCADREAAITMDFEERNAAAKKAWLPDRKARKDATEKRHYDELGASVDKFTLVQMLCNLGNEGNARRICETPPLGFEGSKLWVRPNEQISKDAAFEQTRENLLAFLGKVLTKADIEYAQAKTDNCDRYWSQLAEVNLRTKGFEPERVEATPAVLTLENGEMVKFKGGYFPLVRDGRNGSRPQNVNALAATDENPAGNISTMTTNSGSSKARTGAAYPVSLIADAEMVTMRNTIHDICYREAMIYFRKNINDPEIFAKLKSKMGVEGTRVFREMLEKCANPYSNAGMDFAEDTVARAASWLRRKTVNATIALNFKIALQNFGNVFLYGNTVDGFTYSDVLTTIPDMLKLTPAHYRQSRATVFAKSSFMRERAKLPDVTIRDVQASGRLSGLEQWGLDWGAMLLERTDNLTAIPIWLKAYNKQIQQGASEQAAVDFADTVIRRTLGSSRVQDVASIQRGGPMYKLFTAFQGFFNTQFNQWYREAHIDAKMFSKGERWEAFKRASAFLVSKFLLACLANIFLGGDGDPLEEDKKGWKKITKELMTYPISVVGGPEGVIANAVVQKAFDMETYGYRMSIVQNTIEKGISFGYKSGRVLRGEAETDALYEPAAEMLAVMLGLPLQISRTGFNAVDIFRGEMEFEMQDIIKRRPKSER